MYGTESVWSEEGFTILGVYLIPLRNIYMSKAVYFIIHVYFYKYKYILIRGEQ